MRRREVLFSESSCHDLNQIYSRIADAAGPDIAFAYVERLRLFCQGLDLISKRGQRRDDIAKGLRITGFERRVTVAFDVTETQVRILRLFYGGADWERHMS